MHGRRRDAQPFDAPQNAAAEKSRNSQRPPGQRCKRLPEPPDWPTPILAWPEQNWSFGLNQLELPESSMDSLARGLCFYNLQKAGFMPTLNKQQERQSAWLASMVLCNQPMAHPANQRTGFTIGSHTLVCGGACHRCVLRFQRLPKPARGRAGRATQRSAGVNRGGDIPRSRKPWRGLRGSGGLSGRGIHFAPQGRGGIC